MGNFIPIYKRWDDGSLTTQRGEYEMGYVKNFHETRLAYNEVTKVVYYYKNGNVEAPYISENGKFCRFIDNQIIEIG